MKTPLTYFYDRAADVFYFSSGAPRAQDETVEAGDDVLLRLDSRTKRVRGFTLLNASRRSSAMGHGVSLPLTFARLVRRS